MATTCLVTGGAGNLACQLSWHLAERFDRVVLCDVLADAPASLPASAVYERCDLLDGGSAQELLAEYGPKTVVHFASLLSGSSEVDRPRAWQVNTTASLALFEACLTMGVGTILFPSSLATFGGQLPEVVDENAAQWPDGLYGVTKVACERLGVYYFRKHGLDFRCVRLPITISRWAPAGAASSFASRAFVEAVERREFTFRVRPTTRVSMLYVEDALKAIVQLMDSPAQSLSRRVYNIHAMCPSAGEIADCIARQLPGVRLSFDPDPAIVALIESWPRGFVDTSARRDWHWLPAFDLDHMAKHLLQTLAT